MIEEEIYLSLGSNMGDPLENLLHAVLLLDQTGIRIRAVSGVYRTAPVGGPEQGDYLNVAAVGCTALEPLEALAVCREIENRLERVRTVRWGPRTIDIDILLYGTQKSVGPVLEIPHPRMRERAFVLIPLRDAAPEKFAELDLETDLQKIYANSANEQKVCLKIPWSDVTMRLKSRGLSLDR